MACKQPRTVGSAILEWLVGPRMGPGGMVGSGLGFLAFVVSLLSLAAMLIFPDAIICLAAIVILMILLQLLDVFVMSLPTRRKRE